MSCSHSQSSNCRDSVEIQCRLLLCVCFPAAAAAAAVSPSVQLSSSTVILPIQVYDKHKSRVCLPLVVVIAFCNPFIFVCCHRRGSASSPGHGDGIGAGIFGELVLWQSVLPATGGCDRNANRSRKSLIHLLFARWNEILTVSISCVCS
jgi:hypothetical protein